MNPVHLFLIIVTLPLLLGGCGEKHVAETKPEEPVAETKPVEEVPLNPNLKYEIKEGTVTITDCDKKASGTITIPVSIEGKPVTSIGRFAFSLCTRLTGITIPDSVTSIGDEAFSGCFSLTSIIIGNGVTSIGISAFYTCRSLTSITIPDSVTSIGERGFYQCIKLTSINVGVGNLNYSDIDGVLFNKEKTLLHTYPADKTGANYTIPDSVTSIGRGSFFQCTSLTSITIGSSVTSIGELAFSQCRKLKSITIPDSITNIGGRAFYGCASLTAVTFLGDAPSTAKDIFYKASPTIYRKPEAKGWGDTFAGRPVKLISEKP